MREVAAAARAFNQFNAVREDPQTSTVLSYNPYEKEDAGGQWRLDLVGLERKLQNELDEGPRIPALGNVASAQDA